MDFEALLAIDEPADLGSCSMQDLRAVRDAYQDVENGLSYARRMVQGRLDTVASELERRRGVDTSELVDRLPSALAG
ncbi:MAG: ABC transporter substrate-binding protein, partial [Acidobacteria bacterium]|nr:ABC transporter substrate-binding protein [Acidobacteriota bacterium]